MPLRTVIDSPRLALDLRQCLAHHTYMGGPIASRRIRCRSCISLPGGRWGQRPCLARTGSPPPRKGGREPRHRATPVPRPPADRRGPPRSLRTRPGEHPGRPQHRKAAGARTVEIDVQLTSDDEIVLMHDTTLERTTNA